MFSKRRANNHISREVLMNTTTYIVVCYGEIKRSHFVVVERSSYLEFV